VAVVTNDFFFSPIKVNIVTQIKERIELKPQLPDEIVEATRQIYESGETIQWIIGDHLVSVVDELGGNIARQLSDDEGETDVRKARAWIIHNLADRIGADRSTLRDRHNMAKFFPPEIRKDYIPPLTFSQLRACKSAGDNWKEHADWARENLHRSTCEIIRTRIKHNGDLPPAWISRWERLVRLSELLVEDEDTPVKIYEVCRNIYKVSRQVRREEAALKAMSNYFMARRD